MSGWMTLTARRVSSGSKPSARKMSSPVQIGTVVASLSRAYWSVYCQGIMSSAQAMLYFSMRRQRRMQSSTQMWPK